MTSGTYVDTGILVKSYASESNSAEADEVLFDAKLPLPLTHFQELEIRNAIRLKQSRGELSVEVARLALGNFQADVDEGRYERPIYDLASVFHRAEELSRAYAVQTKCRSLDVLHVAAALEIGSDEFASFDERQRAVARKAGLKVLPLRVPKR